MDYATFKAIVDEVGPERILQIYFDNDRVEYYPDGDFNMDDAVDINGELIIKAKRHVQSFGVKGGKIDIPVTVYNAEVQSVITLDNEEDRKRLDRHAVYHN